MALSHQNNVPAILSEFYILFAITLATIVSRVIVRMRYSKGWGWDDTFIIIALVCLPPGSLWASNSTEWPC